MRQGKVRAVLLQMEAKRLAEAQRITQQGRCAAAHPHPLSGVFRGQYPQRQHAPRLYARGEDMLDLVFRSWRARPDRHHADPCCRLDRGTGPDSLASTVNSAWLRSGICSTGWSWARSCRSTRRPACAAPPSRRAAAEPRCWRWRRRGRSSMRSMRGARRARATGR